MDPSTLRRDDPLEPSAPAGSPASGDGRPSSAAAVDVTDPTGTAPDDRAGPDDASVAWSHATNQWGGWRRIIFPAIFLVYLLQTANAVHVNTSGIGEVAGYVILIAFCNCYLAALPARWTGNDRVFWTLYAATFVLMAAEAFFAHQDAFIMGVYVVVLTMGSLGKASLVVSAALVAVAVWLPPLIPSWDTGPDVGAGFSIVLVSLAMFAFFGVIRSNQALAEARTEVARLAAENERTRIARDLHDLLGHSLTTITVKAGLAHRLSARDPERAAAEMAEVEDLARRSLADVRATISGYREVTLAGELATGREILRAAGITAELPASPEATDPRHRELFGWVLREGLTNVVRHSRATHCRVALFERRIEITDDGVGAGLATPRGAREQRRAGGHGLVGLRERVEAAGGRLEVGALEPSGWRLAVEAGDGRGGVSGRQVSGHQVSGHQVSGHQVSGHQQGAR